MQIPTVLRRTMVGAAICFVPGLRRASDGATQPGGTNSTGNVALFPRQQPLDGGACRSCIERGWRAGFPVRSHCSVEGAPTGMTGSPSRRPRHPAHRRRRRSPFTPGLSVAAGTYNLTVRATGSGVADATAALAFTVTVAQARFSLVPLTRTLSIPAGGRVSTHSCSWPGIPDSLVL